jgi:PPOX class probable F420-dependent enzyme
LDLTAHLPDERRAHVDRRLATNVIAWLTTVDPRGRPHNAPVWFLRDDERFVVFSQPGTAKLRNISANPNVTLHLDVTDLGRDIIGIDGTAALAPDMPSADRLPAYVAKYTERIGAMFGSVDAFASAFSIPIVITATRVRA